MRSDMDGTSQLVKRIDNRAAGRGSQVDINSRTVDGMVAEIRSQGKKIHAVLIAVCCISVAQGMGTETAVQPEFILLVKDDLLEPLLIHWLLYVCLLGKEPGSGAHVPGAGIPVIPDILTKAFRDWDIAVRMVFGDRDINLFSGKENIVAFQMAQFIKSHTCSIKERAGEPCFWVLKGTEKLCHMCTAGDKRKIGIKFSEGNLGGVPWLVKNIDP